VFQIPGNERKNLSGVRLLNVSTNKVDQRRKAGSAREIRLGGLIHFQEARLKRPKVDSTNLAVEKLHCRLERATGDVVNRQRRIASPEISLTAASTTSICALHVHESLLNVRHDILTHVPAGSVIVVVFFGKTTSTLGSGIVSVRVVQAETVRRCHRLVFQGGGTLYLTEKRLLKD
jgi:hypothetical protein